MIARYVALLNMAWCKQIFPNDALGMSKLNIPSIINIMDHNKIDSGSHKYIPQEKLNADLGLPKGAGVSAYYQFLEDKSYILLTCNNGIAVWSGKKEDKAYFPDYDNLLSSR